MPVDFLTEEHRRNYGRFTGEPSPEQLARYFYLDDSDLRLARTHRGDHHRLGFATQLGTVRFLGTFLSDLDVPGGVVSYLAAQLGVAPSCMAQYREVQTRRRHAREIRVAYGYRDFGGQPETFRLIRWLYTRAWLSDERPTLLFDMATTWLAERKVLLPGASLLERLVARIRDRATARLWRRLSAVPTPQQRAALEALLRVPEGAWKSPLDQLRQGPTRVSAPSFLAAVRRWEMARSMGMSQADLSHLPLSRIKALARFTSKTWAAHLARMPEDRRVASLVAFAHTFEATAVDDALDVLELLLSERLRDARKEGEREAMRTRPALAIHAMKLLTAVQVLLDEENVKPERVREVAFGRVSRKQLAESAEQVGHLGRPTDEHVHQELVDRYRTVRRFLPTLLRSVPFQATKAGRPVLETLRFLASIEGRRNPDMSGAPLKGLSESWRRLVVGRDGRIDRKAYTLFVMEKLHEALRRRDVFLEAGDRWSDPRAKLLQGAVWEAARPHVLRTLSLDRNPEEALQKLKHQLDAAYLRTAANLPKNEAIRIQRDGELDRVVLAQLDELKEPDSLVELRKRVAYHKHSCDVLQ